jgi:hypothetical protein
VIKKPYRFIRTVRCLTLALVVATLPACSGALFKVKPVVDLPALPTTAKSVNAGGVAIRVAPLLTDEESQNLFEANLPLGGVLPVRVELSYEPPAGAVSLDFKRTRFRLRDGQGNEWKLLAPKQAVLRILKANDVSVYTPNSRLEFEKEFTAYAIELRTPLTTSEHRRQGFLFFQTPGKEPVRNAKGLVLSLAGLSQPLEIQLN